MRLLCRGRCPHRPVAGYRYRMQKRQNVPAAILTLHIYRYRVMASGTARRGRRALQGIRVRFADFASRVENLRRRRGPMWASTPTGCVRDLKRTRNARPYRARHVLQFTQGNPLPQVKNRFFFRQPLPADGCAPGGDGKRQRLGVVHTVLFGCEKARQHGVPGTDG